MAVPSPNTRLPGTRSTESVPDADQMDFLRRLWPGTVRPPSDAAGLRDALAVETLEVPGGTLTVRYVRHPRARRYRLLFRRDGTARCTLPRRGTLAEARRFVAANEPWLTERWQKHRTTPSGNGPLRPGQPVWIDGTEVPLEVTPGEDGRRAMARLGALCFPLRSTEGDLRPQVEKALRREAARQLPAQTQELAALHGLQDRLRQVSVRNQQTRWGSCSPRGLICLNWRLIQTPAAVREYVILHELAHLRHLNHSPRFWAEVEKMCPDYATAEQWLKRSGRLVL